MTPSPCSGWFCGKNGSRAAVAADCGVSLLVQWIRDDTVVADVISELVVSEVDERVYSDAV